ncbi:MAG: hypothetical protein O7B99_04850 [Planctomycetota bacterium]|nr:hypothetical protein [Planctomycetota bacterium]
MRGRSAPGFFLLVALALLASLFFLEDGETSAGDEPMAVLEDFYAAVAAGDVARAREHLLLPVDEERMNELSIDLETTVRDMSSGEVSARVCEERLRGDWAMVVTRFERRLPGEPPEVHLMRVMLVRRDGAWKVTFAGVLDDPALELSGEEDRLELERRFDSDLGNLHQLYDVPQAR